MLFQKWLKNNTGKTYGDAINAYYQILEEKKREKQRLISNSNIIHIFVIFFSDNQGRSLEK